MNRTLVKIEATTPDGLVVKKQVSYVARYCRYFFNRQHIITKLASNEMSFYEYLCEHMDSGNRILIDKEQKARYISFMKNVTSNKRFLRAPSLNRYISKFRGLGLIVLWGSQNSALYLINPRYAYIGTETNRTKLLQNIIELRIKNGESIQAFIDVPEKDFLSISKAK